MEIDKRLILNKIKSHYNFKADADFARFLGISPQTLYSWHTRNVFDLELLYAKCADIDANWLLTGGGNMLRNTSFQQNAHTTTGNNSQVSINQRKDTKNNSYNNNKGVIISDNTNANIDNRQYYSDSPDVLRAQIDERDRLIGEKEKIIFEKDERIREKDERIREKDERIRELVTEKDELKQRVKELESR